MLKAMSLDEVWYLVSPQNPLKQNTTLLDENTRLHLVQLALSDHPHLIASDYEFYLPRPSYTWDTLQALKHDHPNDTFVLIIGQDNLECFDKWAHYKDLLQNYEIAVYPRISSNSCFSKESRASSISSLPISVHFIDFPLVNISSTEIREMIKKGEDITPFVPLKVAQEVYNLSLYR